VVAQRPRLVGRRPRRSPLFLYGVVPTYQPARFGRVYAAYGGWFVVLSLTWGWALDRTPPDRYDLIGGLVGLAGVAIIMYSPR
jgi:small multidrug resistance family-3 protein